MILKREMICFIALPQATNEREASFHLDPASPSHQEFGKIPTLVS